MRPLSPANSSMASSASPSRSQFKLSSSHALHPTAPGKDDTRRGAHPLDDGEPWGIGARGCVWGTEEREYRYVASAQSSQLELADRPRNVRLICSECLDDGALFALLLGPLIASGMLHDTLRRLTSTTPHLRPRKWEIEPPMVLDSTPMRFGIFESLSGGRGDIVKALSALATSRRNLVQLFTLCSFVLLVHLVRSLHLEVKLARASTVSSTTVAGTGEMSASMERENSDPYRNTNPGGTGTYWLKRGEWKRTRSAVGFACLVTVCCIGVKIITAIIGHGVWSGTS